MKRFIVFCHCLIVSRCVELCDSAVFSRGWLQRSMTYLYFMKPGTDFYWHVFNGLGCTGTSSAQQEVMRMHDSS